MYAFCNSDPLFNTGGHSHSAIRSSSKVQACLFGFSNSRKYFPVFLPILGERLRPSLHNRIGANRCDLKNGSYFIRNAAYQFVVIERRCSILTVAPYGAADQQHVVKFVLHPSVGNAGERSDEMTFGSRNDKARNLLFRYFSLSECKRDSYDRRILRLGKRFRKTVLARMEELSGLMRCKREDDMLSTPHVRIGSNLPALICPSQDASTASGLDAYGLSDCHRESIDESAQAPVLESPESGPRRCSRLGSKTKEKTSFVAHCVEYLWSCVPG
jgi:hypothetical protein